MTNQPEPCEAEKQLNADLCTLRQWMGDKRFWAHPTKPRLARKGVTVQYLRHKYTNPGRVGFNFTATLLEFTRRAMMLGVLDDI
jgi:hypothetical protein